MKNKVSIITPLYNSKKYIAETIDSVLSQTYIDWEMIIVDDLSTDGGAEIVEEYSKKDGRIKLIRLEKNGGPGASRNIAIKRAEGRYIAFLDSDDIWLRDKLEKQIKFMREMDIAFSFTSYMWINEKGESLEKIIEVPKETTYKKSLLINKIGNLTVIYDVDKLGKVYLSCFLKAREDYALWLKILKRVKGYGLNEVLAHYRVRGNSFSSNKMELIKYQWKLYRDEEKLSVISSLFYLSSIIFQKILGIK